MPFAGAFPSSALLLILLHLLWAEAQPVEGLMPKNATATGGEMCMRYQGSDFGGEARLVDKDPVGVLLPVPLLLNAAGAAPSPVEGLMPRNGYCEVLPGNATATSAAEMCMCYQGSAFDGEPRLVDKDPVAVLLPVPGALLLDAAGAAPWRAPSPTTELQRAPPPTLPGTAPAHEKDLSWPPWALLALAVTIWIIVFLSWPPVPRIDANGDSPLDGEFFYCAICMEKVPGTLKFSVGSCGHEFCSSCIAQYVAAKLGENLARVECPDPGCRGLGAVEPESCRGIISPDLLDRWGILLCESAFGARIVYCPYRECSAPLLADGNEAIAQAECPHCHRLFCTRCAVPWHADIGCREFQQLRQDERGRDDLLLRQLAGRQRWQRCPKCQMYVEKSEGCNYIKCRCGYSFCYRCASKVSAITHYCNKCKR